MDMSFVGGRIKEKRLSLGLTQTQIMNKTGISSGNMSDIENGKKLPSSSTLCMLSNVLNCSIDWILTGEYPKCENLIDLNEQEIKLVKQFRILDYENKEEILDIIDLKISRVKRATKSYTANFENSNTDIA